MCGLASGAWRSIGGHSPMPSRWLAWANPAFGRRMKHSGCTLPRRPCHCCHPGPAAMYLRNTRARLVSTSSPPTGHTNWTRLTTTLAVPTCSGDGSRPGTALATCVPGDGCSLRHVSEAGPRPLREPAPADSWVPPRRLPDPVDATGCLSPIPGRLRSALY